MKITFQENSKDLLIDPMSKSHSEFSPAIRNILSKSKEEMLEVYKTHRNRIIEAVKLLDANSEEYPVYRHNPHYARDHLIEELMRLERIILSMEKDITNERI